MDREIQQFSEREKEVLRLLLQARSNKQIALELGISIRTVEFHLSNIYARLGVASRAEATLKLNQGGPVETTDPQQGFSTVAKLQEVQENTLKSMPHRSAMKNLSIASLSLLATALIVLLIVMNLPGPQVNPPATLTVNLPVPTSTTNPATASAANPTALPQITQSAIPAHTVNGYTAKIESYSLDAANIIFQVRLSGPGIAFGDPNYYFRISNSDLLDENGKSINASGGTGPALDPALVQVEFRPVALLTGSRLRGQFAFDLNNAPVNDQILAKFRFDLDVPILAERRFSPKKTASANGLEILLDSVSISPTFTQIYVCFLQPSFADWNIGSDSMLQIGDKQASPYNYRLLFDAAMGGDRRAGSEPYWAPPVKNGRCLKTGFAIGSTTATTLTLTIPELEKSDPDILMTDKLVRDYPELSPKQAYQAYIAEHGGTFKGPWVFILDLTR